MPDYSGSGSGLIPAHAGSTEPLGRVIIAARAHPRSRGEHQSLVLLEGPHCGSSPLTRGARVGQGFSVGGVGLIPAHAGSTR
ncbi:hypothetical protein HMPREF0307_02210 [Corynebacterium sp. DNF00584]|nr:hypothetical protein HMPREF0307_02210 [Corynebacterium sp. DNF00584]